MFKTNNGLSQKRNNTNNFQHRTIAELLRAIRKKELRSLTNYLNARCTPATRKLWQTLKPKYPQFNVTDDYIRKEVRPESPITDIQFRRQLAELSKYTKAFITEQEYTANKLHYANTLANALMKRRAKLNYKKTWQQNVQLFSANKKPDANHYHHQYENQYIDFQFNLLYHPMKVGDSLQLASNYHDYSFLIKKLRFLIAIRNRQRMVNQTFNTENEQAFLDYLNKFPLDELPLINAYSMVLRLFQETTYDLFIKYKEHLFSIRHQFDEGEIRQLLTLAGNLCSWNIQKGQLEFLDERFAITKIQVEEEFLRVLGHFSNNHFRTTLRTAIEAKQLAWAYEFLKTKLPLTHPDHQTNLELLGWASWYFAKGDYMKQQEYLIQMQSADYKFTDFINELSYKVLCLKTDYMLLGEHPKKRIKEAFQNHLRTFLRYCERKEEIPMLSRTSVIHFGQALRLIFNKRYSKKRGVEDLETTVLGLQPIAELPWLLECCEGGSWSLLIKK